MAVCVCDVPVCAFYERDLLLNQAEVVKSGQVCDKETKGTNSSAVEDTAEKKTQ